MMTDPIADMLTRIRNANRVGRKLVLIPKSKICVGIAQVLKEEGYIDSFDVVGHLLVRSRTFGEGLDRVVAYSRILHDAGRFEYEHRGKTFAVFPGCRGLAHEIPRQIAEFSAAAVLVLGRAATWHP